MKICIIGGGTAGWISAFMLSQIETVTSINVIESDKIDIIGTGEGSTGIFSGIVERIGPTKFMENTNSTYKLGIQHRDWYKKGNTYNGPIDSPANTPDEYDDLYKKLLKNNDSISRIQINSHLMDHNYHPKINVNGVNLKIAGSVAYHFDGQEVGKVIKKYVLDADSKVTSTIDTINNATLSDDGTIREIQGEKTSYDADLFIDCTGFRRLLNDYIKEPWISYKDHLAVDTAIPFLLDKKDMKYTVAQAMNNGWMWQIPKKDKLGCGYNFSSKYCTEEEAIQEVENFLGQKITPIKTIKYNVGSLENVYSKNVMFLGLSANFLEPLEATSIHTTIEQLYRFVEVLEGNKTKEEFNNEMSELMEDMRDFIALHYRVQRDDTEFWKSEKNRTFMSEKLKEQLECFTNGELKSLYKNIAFPLMFPIAYGLNLIDINKIGTYKDVTYNAEELTTRMTGLLRE
jgi:tryptophan 6-halogenase